MSALLGKNKAALWHGFIISGPVILSSFLKSIAMPLNSKKLSFLLFLPTKKSIGKNEIVFSGYNVWTLHLLRIYNFFFLRALFFLYYSILRETFLCERSPSFITTEINLSLLNFRINMLTWSEPKQNNLLCISHLDLFCGWWNMDYFSKTVYFDI